MCGLHCLLASDSRSKTFVVRARGSKLCDILGVLRGVCVCVCVMKIRQPVQFPTDNHDVRYLFSHRACAKPSTAVMSQLSTHTTLQIMINKISSSVIKVITRDTLWKATESAATEYRVFFPEIILSLFSDKRH